MVSPSFSLSWNYVTVSVLLYVVSSSLLCSPICNYVEANEKVEDNSEQLRDGDEKNEGMLIDFIHGENKDIDEQILHYSYDITQSDFKNFGFEKDTGK